MFEAILQNRKFPLSENYLWMAVVDLLMWWGDQFYSSLLWSCQFENGLSVRPSKFHFENYFGRNMRVVIGNYLGFHATSGARWDVFSFSYWTLSRQVILYVITPGCKAPGRSFIVNDISTRWQWLQNTVVTRQSSGTYASVGIAALCCADNTHQTVSYLLFPFHCENI